MNIHAKNIVVRTAAVALLCAAALGAQTPPGAPAAEGSRARVRGRVFDARTRAAVKGAKVVIGIRDEPTTRGETDLEGIFDIPNAPAGETEIRVSKSGYATFSRRILIPAGGELEDIRIEMNRLPVITGTITGPDGAPLAGALVHTMVLHYSDRRWRFESTGGSSSDDRGIFRAWRLFPNEYVVAVEAPPEPGRSGETIFRAANMYYPNALSLARAGRIHLDWGQVQEEIDLQLEPAASTRVDGLVHFSEVGSRCCEAELYRQEDDDWHQISSIRIRRDGAFSLVGLSPGFYALAVAVWSERDDTWGSGGVQFTVADDRDIKLRVDAYRPQRVSGRVVLVDPPASAAGPDAEPWEVSIYLEPYRDPVSRMADQGTADVSAKGLEGAFELMTAAGRYRIGAFARPADRYIRDVTVAGHSAGGGEIYVPVGGVEDVVISVACDAGKVAGEVDQGKETFVTAGLLPPRPAVLLFAEPRQPFVDTLSTLANRDGSFEIGRVPPGHYRAVAISQSDSARAFRPAIHAKLAGWSKQMEVKAGQTTAVDLRLAPSLSEIQ